MQKEDLAIPDMITQVKRNEDGEEEYSGGISARREKGEGKQETTKLRQKKKVVERYDFFF